MSVDLLSTITWCVRGSLEDRNKWSLIETKYMHCQAVDTEKEDKGNGERSDFLCVALVSDAP